MELHSQPFSSRWSGFERKEGLTDGVALQDARARKGNVRIHAIESIGRRIRDHSLGQRIDYRHFILLHWYQHFKIGFSCTLYMLEPNLI